MIFIDHITEERDEDWLRKSLEVLTGNGRAVVQHMRRLKTICWDFEATWIVTWVSRRVLDGT